MSFMELAVANSKESRDIPTLMVATSLDHWETDSLASGDVRYGGQDYRPLDPPYYAWLRARMERTQAAWRTGKLAPEVYESLRQRFNRVHALAMSLFGEEALLRAVRAPGVESYEPPGARAIAPQEPDYLYPAEGDWPFAKKVSHEALAAVNAIKEQALALGWPEARLYQNRGKYRFPHGEDYGLICYLGENSDLGELTPDFIEIKKVKNGNTMFFYRGV